MIIHTKHFPFGGFKAITLWPFIFIKGTVSDKTLRHERIHLRQQAETLFVLFYIVYGISWLVQLIKRRDAHEAYHNIILEREAFAHQGDQDYLSNRPFWAWVHE